MTLHEIPHGDTTAVSPPDETPLQALRRDLPSALIAVFLFLVPLYRTRVLEDSFNTPKIAFTIGLGLVCTIAILARRHSAGGISVKSYPAIWLLVIFAVWQALSSLWAHSKPLAVDGTVYFAAFAVWGWLLMRGPLSLDALRGLFNSAAGAAVVTAAWVLWNDFAGGDPGIVARLPDWRGLLSAGLGNSGHIAGMVGMFLPWLILNFLRRSAAPSRWLWLAGITLSFAALTITWSVGSAGATIISLAVWGIIAMIVMPRGALRWHRMGWIIAAGLAVMAFYFTPNPANPHTPSIYKQAFASDRWEAGWPTRLVIWKTTLNMIGNDPFLGAGTGNFTYMYTQQVVPSVHEDPALRLYAGSFTNDAHNDFLQVWAEGGVIGLALWAGVVASFFVYLARALYIRRRQSVSTTDSGFDKATRHRCHPGGAAELDLLIAAGAGFTVFALDGLMSFPMRLPAHFAMAVFFLSVPGIIMRIGATEYAQNVGATSRRFGHKRHWRFAGVGILLTLAASSWHFGHRVVAEYHLKAGRNLAESALVNTGNTVTSPWAVCRGLYAQILSSIASGTTTEDLAPDLETMRSVAMMSPMQHARASFEQALHADRWYANASSRLGDLLIFQNEWHRCMDVTRRTLKTLETHEVHERMGLAAYLAGDMKKAREHWTICQQRMPHTAEFYERLLERTRQ